MAENVENPILAPFREMRAEMAEVRSDRGDVRREMHEEFDSTNARIDGVSLLLSTLAGHVHGLGERIEGLEDPKGR